MGKLIPFYIRRNSASSTVDARATDLIHRCRTLEPQHLSMLAGLLELIPRLNEMAAKVEILHKLAPVGLTKSKLDHHRAELLFEINRAKGKVIDTVMSSLGHHGQVKEGKNR